MSTRPKSGAAAFEEYVRKQAIDNPSRTAIQLVTQWDEQRASVKFWEDPIRWVLAQDEIMEQLSAGQRIKAIKIIRDSNPGFTLKESIELIREIGY